MTHPIVIEHLGFTFPNKKESLFSDINLQIEKGEVVSIVGLSGSGKSTLCYCLSGIIPHMRKGRLEGKVMIKGRSTSEMTIPEISTKLGILFQNPDTQLFSPTVEDEIAFGPENMGMTRSAIAKRIDDVLEKVGITKLRFKNPKELSGGEKQLVALTSVLSLDPEILIFDEAMSQLDSDGKKMMKKMISELKNQGKTLITIEHDFDNLRVADRVKLLKNGKLKDFNGEL